MFCHALERSPAASSTASVTALMTVICRRGKSNIRIHQAPFRSSGSAVAMIMNVPTSTAAARSQLTP